MPDNQTQEEWLELPIVANDPHAKGTGIVLRKSGGPKEFIEDTEYEELVEDAELKQYYAFVWVPHAVASSQQLKKVSCNGRCKGKCRPGCICNRSKGRCV